MKDAATTLSQDTKSYWKRRALKAEIEAETMRNIRQVDSTMEQRLVAENAAMRVALSEIRDILGDLVGREQVEVAES